jgi:hypothetical protein
MGTKQSFKYYELYNIISRNVIKMVCVLYPCPLIPKLDAGNEVNHFAFENVGRRGIKHGCLLDQKA